MAAFMPGASPPLVRTAMAVIERLRKEAIGDERSDHSAKVSPHRIWSRKRIE